MTDGSMDGGAPAPGEAALRFHHVGQVGEILPIALRNFALTFATFGIYGFWARTRVRRYLWSRTAFLGDALGYTGQGSDLFKGFLRAAAVIFAPLVLLNFGMQKAFGAGSAAMGVYVAFACLLLVWFAGYALWSARRYRLSRTGWRGMRAGLDGSAAAFASRFLGYWLFSLVTLGLATPLRDVALFGRFMNSARFGNHRFTFTGRAGPLFRPFLASTGLFLISGLGCTLAARGLLAPVTELVAEAGPSADAPDPATYGRLYLGLLLGMLLYGLGLLLIHAAAFSLYRARLLTHLVSGLRLGGARLTLSPAADAVSLAWLATGNMLISVLTFGMAAPVAQMRTLRWYAERLEIGNPCRLAQRGMAC
jgi:uncharacterized membrane protein YjgN (DUF898 family)